LIQSEARIILHQKSKKIVDKTYLACTHHSVMIGACGFFMDQKEIQCLLVGLGGGGLATYMTNNFEKVKLTVVEIDEAIIRVAKDQFGFNAGSSNKIKVVQEDGIKYIEKSSSNQSSFSSYNIIMFDVDSKDSSLGMSSPPRPFVTPEFLATVKQILHHSQGELLNH
jgi:spermidine synthase